MKSSPKIHFVLGVGISIDKKVILCYSEIPNSKILKSFKNSSIFGSIRPHFQSWKKMKDRGWCLWINFSFMYSITVTYDKIKETK